MKKLKFINFKFLFIYFLLAIAPFFCFSQFHPSHIAGLQLWLRADSLVDTTASGSMVTQWNDCTSNHNNAIQSTTANQPLWMANILSGKPVIRFNGSSDFLTVANNASLSSANISIFIVYKVTTGAQLFLLSKFSGGFGYAVDYTFNTTNDLAFYNSYTWQVTPPITPNKYNISEFLYGTSGGSIYNNSTNLLNFTYSGDISYNSFDLQIGQNNSGGYFLKGDIAEIIIYNQALITTDRQSVENYLAAKYGGKVNLGADINISYGFCDTILDAGSQFSSYLWSTGETTQKIYIDHSETVWIDATDVFGYHSYDTINVTISHPPIKLNDTIFCSGGSINLSTGLSGNYTYNWTGGLSSPTINVSSPGNYSVTVTDTNSCTKISDTIIVAEDTFPSTASLGPDTSICRGNSIGLISPSSLPAGLTYQWSDLETSSSIVINQPNGVYNYSVTVTDLNSCVATDDIKVTISGSAPVVNFNCSTACSGSFTQFNNTSTPGDSLKWNFGDGQSSTLQNPSHTYTTGNNYTVRLTIYSGICSNFKDSTIYIQKSPVATFTADTLCANNAYLFMDQSTSSEGNIISWYWDFGDGGHSHAKDTSYAYSSSGNYTVSLTVQTDSGCTNSAIHQITVINIAAAPLPFTLYLPTNGFVTTNNTIKFAWNSSPKAVSYTFEYSTDSLFTTNVTSFPDLTNTALQKNISNSQTYFWHVIAYGICGNSFISETNKFTIFQPNSIPGMQLWFMGDSVHINGNKVDTLFDCSGYANNAIQSSGTNQPLWVANQLNSKPIIRFNGSSDYLTIPDNSSLDINRISLFIVYKDTLTTQQYIFDKFDMSSPHYGYGMTHSLNINNDFGFWDSHSWHSTINTVHSEQYNISEILYGVTGGKFYNNGAPFGAWSYTSDISNASVDFVIGQYSGGGYNLKGDIAEIIIYNQALSTTDRQDVENYLHYKYAPPVNLGPDIWSNNFCPDTLFTGNRFVKYKWSTTATNPADTLGYLKVLTGGIYSITATDVFGFKSTDTVIVHKPTITAHDTMACYNSSVTLYAGLHAPYKFNWHNGSTADSLVVTAASTDTLTVSDPFGCFVTKVIHVLADSFPVKASVGSPPSIDKCGGDSVYLVNGAGTAASYVWWDGTAYSYGSSYPVTWTTGTHSLWLTVTDNMGCVANLSENIIVPGAQPNVGFAYYPVCYPGPTNTGFDDTSTPIAGGTLSSWEWIFGNGDTIIKNNSNLFYYPYDSAAIYNVTLTVSTMQGCSKSITQQVPVYSVPTPAFQPHLGCSGVPLVIKDKSTSLVGNVTHWNWVISDPFSTQNTSNADNIVHTFDSVGIYIVTLIDTTIYGCTAKLTDSVKIRFGPKVGFSYTSVCDGNPVYFNDTTQTWPWANIIHWHWNFGNGQISAIQNPVCTFNSAGTYNVSLTVNAANGCTVTDTVPVVVHAIPEAIFMTSNICAGDPYTFHDSSLVKPPDTISTWLWNFGNGSTSAVPNPTITFPASGSYIVSLNISSNAGCPDSAIHTIHVNPSPTAAFLPDDFYGVAPFSVTFINSSLGAYNYLWDFGDGTALSSQYDPTHNYTSNGIYTVSLVVYNQYNCKDSTTQQLMVIPLRDDIAVTNVKPQKQGNFITLSADINNLGLQRIPEINIYAKAAGGTSFMETWKNILNPLEPGDTLHYTFNGQYELPEDQSAKYICVEAQIANHNPDDNPSNNEQCITFTDQFIAFDPYPAPSHDQIHIDFILPFSDNVDIELYGTKGDLIKTIFSGKADKGLNKLTFDVSDLALAVYTYRIIFRDDIRILKFVKY